MWVVYAMLSALFAALTSIWGKMGMDGVNSSLATAIRTVVALLMAWGVVFATGRQSGLPSIGALSWFFLALSGCATGVSWLCYYKALQMGEASKVVPIDKFSVVIAMALAAAVLREPLNLRTVAGGVIITLGTLMMAL
jgi:transporter family protein